MSIKIAYKGKNILLPKGMDSIKKIEDELISRFPGDFVFGVSLKYLGNAITDYAQIDEIFATGVKSLKIQAEQKAQRKASSFIKDEKKQVPVEKVQIKEVEVKVQQVQEQTKIEVKENPPAVEIQEKVVEVQVTEVKQEVKPVQEPEENNQVVDISIDSMSSELELQDPEEIGQVEKKEVPIEQNHEPKIVKDINEEVKPEPIQVKCTIYNEIPKVQEKLEPEAKQDIAVEHEEIKPEIIKCAIFGSEIRVSEPKIESQIRQKPLELLEISPGVFECIFCRPYEVCNVCETSRKLDQSSRFFVLINKIVERKINQRLENFENMILEKLRQQPIKQKEIEKPAEKKEQKEIVHHKIAEQIEKEIQLIKAAFLEIQNSEENRKEVQLNEEINWTFHIKIKKQMIYRHKACLIEERSGETINVDLTNNMIIKVGPFKAEKQGKFEKTYRFCIIKEDESMQTFGPRFGFSINIIKPKVTKVLTNNFRKYLEQTKKAYKCEDKPTEYLVERLREIGIVEENYEESKAFIPEIICTL